MTSATEEVKGYQNDLHLKPGVRFKINPEFFQGKL